MKETEMGGAGRAFEPTRWSLVLRAQKGAREALEALLAAAWKPVYYYVRRWGADVDDAKDLTQGFFAEALRRDFLADVAREKGSFRAFLLAALRHYLVNQAEAGRTQKRGAGKVPRSIDFADAERSYRPAKDGPDAAFHREWALTVLERALSALAKEMTPERFEAAKAHLSPGDAPSYEETARRLGVSVTDVKNLLHKTRKRYRDLIREEARAGLREGDDVEDEVRDLFRWL